MADALEAATAYDAVSLDSPAYRLPGRRAGATFLDSLGTDEERYDMVEYAVTIETALRALPARQRAILRLRFREDMTQAEIASGSGMSQMHVSRLLRQALGRLREVARVRHGPQDASPAALSWRRDRSPRRPARLSERRDSARSPRPQSEAQNDGKAASGEPKRRPGGGTREDRRLLIRYHEEGDASAREELVERFLPLARQLARRYQRQNEPLDDLMQVASMGLVKAIDRFDPSRGTAFSTYAVPTILGELKRYFRDSGWAVHVPRGMQERVMKLDQASQELHRKLGPLTRPPRSWPDELGLTSEEVLEAMEAASAYDAISLEEQRGSEPGTPRSRRTPTRSASRRSATSWSSTGPRSLRR